MKENFLPRFVSDHKYQVIHQISNIVLSLSFIFLKNSSLQVICLLDACGLLGDAVCAGTTPHALLCCQHQALGRSFWEVRVRPGSQARFASPPRPTRASYPPTPWEVISENLHLLQKGCF